MRRLATVLRRRTLSVGTARGRSRPNLTATTSSLSAGQLYRKTTMPGCCVLMSSTSSSTANFGLRVDIIAASGKPIIAGADGPAPASPSMFSVRGPRQRAQGSRESLQATSRQRSARATCYGVCSQFWPRGRDTYSAWLQCQPSRSRPGHQTHQTYCLPTSSEPPPPPSVAWCAQQVRITCPSPLSLPLVRRQPRLGGVFLDDGALNRSF